MPAEWRLIRHTSHRWKRVSLHSSPCSLAKNKAQQHREHWAQQSRVLILNDGYVSLISPKSFKRLPRELGLVPGCQMWLTLTWGWGDVQMRHHSHRVRTKSGPGMLTLRWFLETYRTNLSDLSDSDMRQGSNSRATLPFATKVPKNQKCVLQNKLQKSF